MRARPTLRGRSLRGRSLQGRSLPGRSLRGRSLRWRVTLAAVVVVALVFLAAGVAVEVALGVALQRDARSRLDDRTARATVLIQQGTAAAELPPLLDGQGVRALVVDPTGRRLGPLGRPAPGASGPTGPATGPTPGLGGRRGRVATVLLPLADGNRLVLVVDPDENEGVLDRLRAVMAVVGLVGLAVTALALLGGVRVALRPLDAMTGLARAITSGDRGGRLRPARRDTELGRTAAAFDEMLDALDAAQDRAEAAAQDARSSEARTRRFLSDAAHELRTPVTSVQALAESLVRRPDADLERRERVATTLVRETRRAGTLVADMLELARIEDGPDLAARPVDLARAAAAEVERTALLAPSLRVVASGEAAVAVADPDRVAQILANLLDNARRHSPPGGRITVSAGPGTGSTGDGGRVWVEVADEGPGVAAADRERVFDRLVRLDDARSRDADAGSDAPGTPPGAGLGLPIARGLARAMAGDLRLVEPGPGTGARCRLTLPAAPPAPT